MRLVVEPLALRGAEGDDSHRPRGGPEVVVLGLDTG
jgi:hypothetical protein